MAYLAIKGDRYYICDSYKVAKLDESGVPLKKPNGKIIYEYKIQWIPSSKNRKLAEIELGRYEETKDRGRIGLDKKDTPWAIVKKRYLDYSKLEKSNSSLKLDIKTFKDIETYAPNISTVKDLSMTFAEGFFLWLKEKLKNSEATIRRKGTTVKNIGKKLVDWEMLEDDPMKRLKIDKVENEIEVKYWEKKEDIQTIIKNATGIWKHINIFGFFIGTRISETLNADWSFVNFNKHTIKIQTTGHFRTKNRKFRKLKMPFCFECFLLWLQNEHSKNKNIKTTRIIVYEDGTFPTTGSASNYLIKYYKAQGFKGYHSHCLRHSFAAHYLFKFKDIYGLSKILGHHSVTVTEKYYGHLLEKYYDDTMAEFSPF